MKITDRKAAGPADAKPLKTFSELLSKTKSPSPSGRAKPAPGKPAAKTAKPVGKLAAIDQRLGVVGRRLSAAQTTADRTLARSSQASAKAERTLGAAHASSARASLGREEQRTDDSLRASLFRELERQERPAPPPPPIALGADRDSQESAPASSSSGAESPPQPNASSAQAPDGAPAPSAAAQRAEAISALVERIEAALKDGKPTLSLALDEKAAAGAIEISRAAKGEVSVRIRARKGERAGLLAEADAIKEALEAKGLKVKALRIG